MMRELREHSNGASLVSRMTGAARLQATTFEDVEADRSATGQAVVVVIVVALATGIGTWGMWPETEGGIGNLLLGVAVGLIGWVIWAWITYLVGTKLLPTSQTKADWGQLARALAFAQSPGVLKVFCVVPVIGSLLFIAVSLWQFAGMVIAVRQALDYNSTRRAVGVVLLAGIPYLILMGILFGEAE
jgi:hypothetical protein